ncbi:hypothetical protein E2C01_001183 [Portunus trituberculatus]|uniref:Uncharacterized protein n=1 Tax=Portunus trituberculatus TaxID=210409 RepID=A0A5B7CIR8_PORTR|nr:hypothetical protein [Portunus trituberculatus]
MLPVAHDCIYNHHPHQASWRQLKGTLVGQQQPLYCLPVISLYTLLPAFRFESFTFTSFRSRRLASRSAFSRVTADILSGESVESHNPPSASIRVTNSDLSGRCFFFPSGGAPSTFIRVLRQSGEVLKGAAWREEGEEGDREAKRARDAKEAIGVKIGQHEARGTRGSGPMGRVSSCPAVT